ncbi:MAG: hypothetical protein M3Y56_16070, partial [Armatimonadota bacterium]|nr:hypothetical protein [Armatimonadota bacterium]
MPAKIIRICPSCGEENLDWASYCTVCQSSLASAERITPRRTLRVPPSFIIGMILCVMSFGLIWTMRQMAQEQQQSGGPAPLRVVWHKFYTLNSHEWIVGEVKNESAVALIRVHVVGEFSSEDSRTIEWTDAPLDQAALLPGHTSHFRVIA